MYWDDEDEDNPKLTSMQKFYYGTNILITGGTGFLGKILLNKLFTSCPGIENIYILVRNKKNKDVHTRIQEVFDDPIFNAMKKIAPKFRHHVHGITGDCMLPNLGLSADDRQLLIDRVNIVFHMAATVRFDEKLKIAMQINVKAARDLMLLCGEMQHLKSVLHVSTAYTQCPLRRVDEKFYPPPSDSKNLILLTECTPEKLLERMTPVLLGKWPNTYTFTKAVAEDVVRMYGHDLPVGIFRPGIVISTYRDPVSGWIDNFYGPTGAIAGAGTGVIRTLRCDPHAVANMVPVDLCVNSILAAAWDIANKNLYATKTCNMVDSTNNNNNNINNNSNKSRIIEISHENCTLLNHNRNATITATTTTPPTTTPTPSTPTVTTLSTPQAIPPIPTPPIPTPPTPPPTPPTTTAAATSAATTTTNRIEKVMDEIPVYNFCTSKDNQLTWGDFTTKTTKYGLMYPTSKALWYLCYTNTPNKYMHMLSIFFLHYLPAVILDALCMCLGKKPRLLNTYKKIHRFMHVIEYFSMRQWDFQIDNVRQLWSRLSERDKHIFFFDMRQLDWDLFLQQYFRGIRQYLLHDPLDTIPQALKRWNRLYWLHQSIKLLVFGIVIQLLWLIYTRIF